MGTVHALILDESPYFSAPVIYMAKCSCRRWRSGEQTDPNDAYNLWRKHANAAMAARYLETGGREPTDEERADDRKFFGLDEEAP